MKDPQEYQRCAARLKALTDPARLRMLDVLFRGEMSVTALGTAIGADVAMASHHLNILLKAGLVQTRREKRFVFYSLHPDVLRLDNGQPLKFLDLGCCTVNFEPNRPVEFRAGIAHIE